MRIPKKAITALIGTATTTAVPLLGDVVNKKLKEKAEKMEQEKIYAYQKQNGMVKIAAILFTLIALFLSILAFKQVKITLGILGLLAVIVYVITILYCLEIIEEKKHNTYKIVFILGNMLMVATATLLFF